MTVDRTHRSRGLIDLHLIYSTFRNSRRFTAIFILNFCIGILGIYSLTFFKGVMKVSLQEQARVYLGSDLVVSSRYPISPADKQLVRNSLPATTDVYEGLNINAMASSAERSRLVQIVQLDAGFPYYGGITLKNGLRFPGGDAALPASDGVWVYPEVIAQLGIHAGDALRIGSDSFVVEGIVVDDSFKAIRFAGFLPRIYMTKSAIDRARLMQKGSTARYSLNFLFEKAYTNEQLEDIEIELEDRLQRSLRVSSPKDGSDRVTRLVRVVADFLSLVSLISLFLSMVGLVYLYAGFLLTFRADMLVLVELGMQRSRIVATYLVHFLLMLLPATLITFSVIALLSPWAADILADQVDAQLVYRADPMFFVQGFLFLVVVTLAVAWPMLMQALQAKKTSRFAQAVAWLPLLAMLIVVSAGTVERSDVGLVFCSAVAILVTSYLGAGFLLLRLLDRSGLGLHPVSALAIKSLVRNRAFTLIAGTALFSSTALFSIIPQAAHVLVQNLALADDDKPRLFLVDIQDDQIDGLRQLAAESGTQIKNLSPFLRGRVGYISADESDRTVNNEGQVEQDKIDRAVNFSYRAHLYPSENIVSGQPFSGRYEDDSLLTPVELSVEQRHADRRGLTVGDRLTFDVMGMDIPAVVANIRTVRWMDFVPNFFYVLQDGALNDAPKTWLGTLAPEDDRVDALILKLATDFPNVTVVDVKYVTEKVMDLAQKVIGIFNQMAALAILIGILIIGIVIQYQMNLRQPDIMRLKVIGVRLSIIRRAFLLEFSYLSSVATLAGLAVSFSGSYALSRFFFETPWVPQWKLLGQVAIIVPAFVMALVSIAGHRAVMQRSVTPFDDET